MSVTAARRGKPGAVSVLTNPHWVGVFMLLAVPLSLVPFLLGFVAGLSVADTSVFGAYAMLSGIAADQVLRRKFNRELVVWRSRNVPFVALWIVLCAYVIAVRPF